MAAATIPDLDLEKVISACQEVNKVVARQKDSNVLTVTAFGKIMKQVIPKDLTGRNTCETYFKKYSEKPANKDLDMRKNKENVRKLFTDVASQMMKSEKILADFDKAVASLLQRIEACHGGGIVKGTKAAKVDVVDRLTDATKYTGSHKERFDDSGKGRGIDGREYRYDDKGYVSGYKGDGTYEENLPK